MAKTFKVAVSYTGTITMQDSTVQEYLRAIHKTAEMGGCKLCQYLVAEKVAGRLTDEEVLQRMFVNGFRDGIKNMGEQINLELAFDDGRYTQSPAKVEVTPHVK